MFKTLVNAWHLPDLRKKFLFTLFMFVIFKIGSVIPVPGIKEGAIAQLLGMGTAGTTGGSVFEFLNILSGGALEQASIFAMGITPYINASIIMQLLTMAIPALERLTKEGDEGRKMVAKWTRYATVILSFITATGLYIGLINPKFNAIENQGLLAYITIVISFTAGTAFLMWMGELINEKGIGNGISLLIFAGIVSRVPDMGIQLFQNTVKGEMTQWLTTIALIVFGLAVIMFVVAMNSAERRIPIQYARRVVGRKMYGGQSTHIPLKLAMAGVIPIIFASSIMAFPSTIANMFGQPTAGFGKWFLDFFGPRTPVYAILYFLLIIFFTYFYTAMTYNPIEISNNIKNNGGSVPGVRPGKPTADYIARVVNKVTTIGALFIAIIAVLPMAMSQGNMAVAFGGTSLLIVVGVALETYRQIEAQMLMRHYKGFLD